MEDITKTGPVGLEGLKGLNQSPSASSQYFQNLQRMSVGELSRAYMSKATENVGVQLGKAGYGDSTYDDAISRMTQVEEIGELRAQEQPWYAQVAAGLTKGLILAATTFLDGTIGLLVGAGQGIANMNDGDPNTGFWSGLWDNDFSKAMQKTNENFEQWLPNYYTQEEQNNPWYKNIFTANFLGDKFIKNLGFSVGAIYSGGVWSKALKATKLPEIIGAVAKSSEMPTMITSTVGATISAVNEGRIEALNNSKDWFEYQHTQIKDQTKERLDDLGIAYYEDEQGSLHIDTSTPEGASEANAYNETLGKLAEDRIKMGNADLLFNIPILATSNYIQFAKFYANGYKTARRAANIAGRAGQYTAGSTKAGAAWAMTKGALSEGMEEISQKAASEIAGNYYETDVNNFYKARTNRQAEQETLSWAKSFAEGINKTVNEGSSWEEFFIGSLTGLLGIPTFRSVRSADGSFQSPVVLEGGAYNHWREYQERRQREQEIVDYMNGRVQSPEFLNYYQGLIRHNKYQSDMDRAVEEGSEFDFKNAEHAQMVSDIVMFDNAGKLEDLVTLINSAYDTSDANLQAIVENTTSTTEDGKKIGPFIDSNGNPMYATPEGKREMIDKLTQSKDEMSRAIDNYVKAKNSIDIKTGQQLSDSQLEELAWMKTQLTNWSERATSMSGEVKEVIGKVIGNLDSFMRFQDAIMTEESMNNAGLTDRYNRADQNVRGAKKAIASLNAIRSLDDASLAANLVRNPQFVAGLMREITLLDDAVIEADEKEEILDKLTDIVRLGNASEVYNAKFREYLENPGKQVEDHERADQEAAREIQEETNSTLRQKLKAATSVAQFRKALQEEQDNTAREEVLRELEAEGNPIAKNYKETTQYNNELRMALDELGESDQVTQDAMTLWQEQFNAAENLEQLAYPNSIMINNEEAFMEDSGGDIDMASARFEEARYALQRAMSKVNNDIKFKNRFSEEYKKPTEDVRKNKGRRNSTTGDSGVSTAPTVNPGPVDIEQGPVGDISSKELAEENKEANKAMEDRKSLDNRNKGQKKYYRPAIPELHIEASKEGDFRPFSVVVSEREPGVNFSKIYEYLESNGAFDYVNSGNLKVGNTLRFMIDPEFEASVEGEAWHKEPTIFIVTKDGQVVGSIDEGSSIASFEGLEQLAKKVRDEYKASRESSTQETNNGDTSISNALNNIKEVAKANEKSGDKINQNVIGMAASVPLINNKILQLYTVLNQEEITDEDIARIDSLLDDIYGALNTLISAHNNGSVNTIAENLIKDLASRIASSLGNKLDGYAERRLDAVKKKVADAGRTDEISISHSTMNASDTYIDGSLLWVYSNRPDQTSNSASNDRFIATPTTKVSKIMVGKVPYTGTERSLNDTPGINEGSSKPVFGVIKNGVLSTGGKIDDRLIIKPVDMANKEGRLYLLIPNAAGTYSPVAVRVKHFNTKEFNLNDATVANTSVGKSITQAIDKLANSMSNDDVKAVLRELSQVLYTRNIHIDFFSSPKGEGIRLVKVERDTNGEEIYVENSKGERTRKEDMKLVFFQNSTEAVTTESGLNITRDDAEGEVRAGNMSASILNQGTQLRDIEDIKKDILNALLSFNLPIQVDVTKINTSGYNEGLISSNVLTSNISQAKVIDSWFTTDYFDGKGNLQKAINPASVVPAQRATSPVGGREGVTEGTRITVSGTSYIVDLKNGFLIDEKTGKKWNINEGGYERFVDLAWAQETFGDRTEAAVMTDNKVITPSGRVLDRTTGKYLTGTEAQTIKDKIAGIAKSNEERKAQTDIIKGRIYEDQKKVDKERTDSDYYYIQEEDGAYHAYERVHKRLGSNWTQTERQSRALEEISIRLSKLADNIAEFNSYLGYLENKYKDYAIDLSPYKGKVDVKSRTAVVNIIRDKMAGTNSQRALDAGTAIDSVVRDFFTPGRTPSKPANMSQEAFKALLNKLTEIKARMDERGETVYADNLVLYMKYPDGTRVAGEVDLLTIDKDGNFRIYDTKTSAYSFYDFIDKRGRTQNYFRNASRSQTMSNEKYYTLQLSAYQNLLESKYGVRATSLGILPFVLTYNKDNGISILTPQKGIPLSYNSAVNVPLIATPTPQVPQGTGQEARQEGPKPGDMISAQEAIRLYNQYKGEYADLARRVFPILEKYNIGIRYVDVEELKQVPGYSERAIGVYYMGEIMVDSKAIERSRGKRMQIGEILLHEAIHALTSYAIDNPQVLSKEAQDAVTVLEACYKRLEEAAKTDTDVKNHYGFKNVKEMVAEMANPTFREVAKKYKLLDKIIDSIKAILSSMFNNNVTATETLEDSILKSLDTLIRSFDGSAFSKSVAIKKALTNANRKLIAHTTSVAFDMFSRAYNNKTTVVVPSTPSPAAIVRTSKGDIIELKTGGNIIFARVENIDEANNNFTVTPLSTYEAGEAMITPSTKTTPKATRTGEKASVFPLFDPLNELRITEDSQRRVSPDNAFEEGGEIGYYELDGKVYTGYLKKVGEVVVTLESGQQKAIPIHVTKIRSMGFGKRSAYSMYLPVFPNGKAMDIGTNSPNDNDAIAAIMRAMTGNPTRVASVSNEETQLYDPQATPITVERKPGTTQQSNQNGASELAQKQAAINRKSAKRRAHKLREAKGPRPVWNREKELAWLDKVLPQLSAEDRVKIHQGLIHVAEMGADAWGMFSDGIMTLSDIAAEGTTYHEAFHVVFNTMMTASEREAIIEEAIKTFGNKDLDLLEEDIAEAFREYVTNQENRSLGRKIIDFFKNLLAKVTHWKHVKPTMNNYFRMINNGRYSDRSINQQEGIVTKEELGAAQLVFDRIPELSTIGTPEEYARYIKTIFPDSKDQRIYWHGSNEDFSEGFKSAKKGKGSGALETRKRNDLYLNRQGWASLQYVDGVNREGKDRNGFAHWNKLWWELKEIMSNGRRENNDWKDIIIDESTIRQAIPNKRGVFNRDTGGGNGKWLSERKADYGYENKSDKEFFEEVFGLRLGKDTFNTWVNRNKEVFKSLETNTPGIYPVVFNTKNPIIEEGQNTYYEEQRGLFTQASLNSNDAILGRNTDNEFGSDVAVVLDANDNNVHWLGTKSDIKNFKQWVSKTKADNDIRYRLVDGADFLTDEEFTTIRDESQRFLDNFGITLREVKDFDGEMPLFDMIDKVINFRNVEEITEGVGYAVAFMMQHNGTMQTLMRYKLESTNPTFGKSARRSIKTRGDYAASNSRATLKALGDLNTRLAILKEIGQDIAIELRKLYLKESSKEQPTTFLRKLWNAIREFFDMLNPMARLRFNVIFSYTKDIANSIKLNDPSIILTRNTKPGTTETPSRVNIERALKEHKYEEGIISIMNSHGIALAGSASIALKGSVWRPKENPLHDIDFKANGFTREQLNEVVTEVSPYNSHIRTITQDGHTETYLVMDRPYDLRKPRENVAELHPQEKEPHKIEKEIFDEKGECLGYYKGNDLILEKDGIKGKFLDFFVKGSKYLEDEVMVLNGKPYLISDHRNAWLAKFRYGRPKDLWDYNRFVPNDFDYSRVEQRKEAEKQRIKDLLSSARVVWGHPAIGKTTYMQRNQDILEWDQEVGEKREQFFREQIDPEHKMDTESQEYKNLRLEYIDNWRNHPEYLNFLITEWNNILDRAERENKRVFTSLLPLLEMFSDEMDLIVNIPENSFLQRNVNKDRGGTPLGSMAWKQNINKVLVQINQNKIVTTDKYFSDFMRENLGVQWGTLTNEEVRALEARGWTEEQFNRLSQIEKDNVLECLPL